MMVAGALAGEWNLVPSADAEASLAEQDRLRQIALTRVRETLTKDFLRSDAVYEAGPAEHLSRAEYEQEKVAFVQAWVARAYPAGGKAQLVPDDEQALAIATVDGHVQLVARAGSGKTETVANRAAFLQRHCAVAPAEMLLLAFNRFLWTRGLRRHTAVGG